MMKMIRSKRGQYYELIMVFCGIVLLVSAFISVFITRSNIPNEPNLPSKTILLTEKTFDTLDFFFKTTVTDVAQNVHLLSSSSLQGCTHVSIEDSTNVLAGYYIVTPECLNSNLFVDYQNRFSNELDLRFASLSSATSGDLGETVHPKSFLFPKPADKFVAGQFGVYLSQKNANAPVVSVISRRPMTLHASAQTQDGISNQWTLDAQRDLSFVTSLSSDDQKVFKIISNLKLINQIAFDVVQPVANDPNLNGKLPDDATKSLLITQIKSALNTSTQTNYLKLATDTLSTDSFVYNVLFVQKTIYVFFPNLAIAEPIYTFN